MKAKNGQFLGLWVVLVFCLYHLPTVLLGQDAYYNAFDTLDSYVVWYKMVVEGGYAFAPPYTIIAPFLGGVPKFTLVSTYNLYYWLNLALSTFRAYQLLTLLISFTALSGMWLLAHNHLGLDRLAAGFLALSFAFTPFLQTWVLSIAGQPLLLYALLNLRTRNARIADWAIVGAFPFVSNFQSAGVFMLFALGLLIVYDFYKKRPVKNLLIAFAVLLAVFSITKIDLIQNMLGGEGFVSHRMEMRRFSTPLSICAIVAARYFLLGNIDVALSLHTFIILPFVPLTYVLYVVRFRKFPLALTGLLATIALICIYIGALQWEPIVMLRNKSDLLRMYSLERVHIFLQLLWHIAAAQAILLLPAVRRPVVVRSVFIAQMVLCFAYQPSFYHYIFSKIVRIQPYHYIFRYHDYYAEEMFRQIKGFINKPDNTYRVASIGIPPAVSQYNGFWTIDGYSSNYPLPYKKKFRDIIASELDKNPSNQGFFDYWGSQCIIVYDQGKSYFETHMTRGMAPASRDITLSHSALKRLSCHYIISAETIAHPEKSGLRQLRTFSSPIWQATLYAVDK